MSIHPFLPRALLLASALALLAPATAARATDPVAAPLAAPEGVAAGPCVEGICEYRLDNGLRVLLFPDSSKPTVTVNLTYGVGSMHENYGETGMAHLLEHLLFKGTPSHDDIPGEMKKRGIGYNATTWWDRTNYFASFPANEAGDDTLEWLLALEADRMVNSRVARSDLDSEMTVVRNELEAGENNPAGVLMQRVRSTAFLWHNYGNPTIGARSDVENMPIERLQAFYRDWYRPDNATLIVAGRIDPAVVLAGVNDAFAEVERPVEPLPGFYTADPAQDGEREVTVRRNGDLRLAMAAYHVPSVNHPDSAALAVLANVLGDVPSGRLHKALVESKLAAGAGAGSDKLLDPGLFNALAAMPADADAAQVEQVLVAQLEDLPATPVTQAELDAAQQRLGNAFDHNYTNVNAVATGLSESIAAGDWRLYFLRRDAIAAVTLDDVNRVAATYLKPSNRTLGRFVPTREADRVVIGDAPDAATLVEGYTGRAAVAAGEQFDPTPDNIQARTRTVTLGDGLQVALLPKKTRGGTVSVSATFRFGDDQSLAGRDVAAGITGAMLMRGSDGLDRGQISERFDALRTRARIDGGLQAARIDLDSRREHLAEALALAAQVLRAPTFPEDELEQLRLQAVTGLQAARQEPASVAGMALAQRFDPWPEGHPLHDRTLDESLAAIQALQLDEVRAFHRDFYGTAQGQVSIVGDFDAEAVEQQLRTLFADWQSPSRYAPINTAHTQVAASGERFSTPDKPNAVLLARSNLSLNVNDADYPALLAANYILGGGGLKSRLADRIRQKDGLSYGTGSAMHADSSREGRDDAGFLSMQVIAAPENMERAEAALREEFARLAADGVDAAELDDAVSGLLTQREQSRASDRSVAGLLARNLYLDRTMEFSADIDARLQSLSVDEVNAAMRKHFRPETLSVFVAGDFDVAGEAAASAPAAP